jgi:hypothetical protein
MHDDESEQALAHEAEAIELIAAFRATQEMVEYVAPAVEWAAMEVHMDVDVAQEQLQRIPAGPQNLTAETFELIQRAHNHVVGHHGVQRTLEKQGIRFEGMRALVKQFIEFCPCCQKMSRIAPAIQATPFTMATYRFGERIDIDTIGPLPKDDYGNEHVVVIVDAFSRFVRLTPVKSTSGLDAARALIDFVGTFACPRIIQSDRGTQFLNDMITSLVMEGFEAFQRVTTAASKEEKAIVERANKEVNRYLRAFVFDIASSVRWSFGLPMIQRIINTTNHSSIGIAPAQLVFASHADLDGGILFEWATPEEQNANHPPARTNAFVADLFRVQAQVLETALAMQQPASRGPSSRADRPVGVS